MSEVTDWIVIDVAQETIDAAKSMRAERDKEYGNIFRVQATDFRWVGEIGELEFNKWLSENIPGQFSWILEETAGKADFVLFETLNLGLKTVKRQGAPKADYTAQITARHAKEPVDDFFFGSYDFYRKKLYLLGGISKEKFLEGATYYGAGEQVHANYVIREGHDIYNIEIEKLTPPLQWLKLKQEQGTAGEGNNAGVATSDQPSSHS